MHYAPLAKIIDAIGLPDAMKLVEHFGGTVIYLPLPENIGSESDIARAVGIESAIKLARAFDFEGDPDRHVEIPLGRPQLRVLMRDQVLRDRETMSEKQLARKYGTTQRTIRRICAEAGKIEQPRLF